MVESSPVEIVLRPAEPADTPSLVAIERASFGDPWSKRSLEEDNCLVACSGDHVIAFLIWRQIFHGHKDSPPEIEILNIAVHPEWRRKGIASRLLESLMDGRGVYFLEVRESNDAAIAMYQHLGFVEIGRRAKYYRRPTETAIVMKMKRC